MITLYKEYAIGVKMLSDAELNRESSPSGQTHIGLSEKVLTYLPNTPIQQEGILVVNQSCSFVECAFSKINDNRSTKVDSLTANPVKSVVKQIRNIASNADIRWFLVWFALENQTPVFWLLNDKSEDYEELSGILEKSQNLSVYTASKKEYFVLLSKVRSIKKLQSAIESKYNVSQENRLIAVSSEHRTFVHLCMDYFRQIGQLDKMLPYFNTEEANVPITVQHDGKYKLLNMFMFADIAEIQKRNSTKNGRRWYTDPFVVNGRDLYLYVDWFPGKDSHGKDTQLMIPDFVQFVSECFGQKYVYRNAQGTHEMWEINNPESFEVVNNNSNTLKNDPEQEEASEEHPVEPLTFADISPRQIIFYGAPGTGKSHTIKKEENAGLTCIRTTFHPDSDYSTFVGCYKPHKCRETETLTYEFVPQAFLEAYTQAWLNPQKEIALVIEEINRGNCAQIFGDIFQLLDRDKDGWSTYPIKADTDIAEYLDQMEIAGYSETMVKKYGESKAGYGYLALPPNMSLLATMNTSDQSLFPIDSAFKRRWDWKYIKIKNGKDKLGNKLNWKIVIKDEADNVVKVGENEEISWWTFIEKINTIIASMTSSADKQLGYFFCKPTEKAEETDEEPSIITADTLVGKVIFYLWNDVFKDYGFEDAYLFSYIEKVEGKDVEKDLTFADFYDEEGEHVNTTRLADFLGKVLTWQKNNEGKE